MRASVSFRAGVLALVCLVWLPALTWAAAVTVSVPVEEGVGAKEREAKALSEAFTQGILAEAEALLPDPLDPERRAALADILSPTAADFVMGYSEISRQETPEALILSMDVKANRTELKRHLERLGLFAGAAGQREVRLAVGGAATPDDVKRLHELCLLAGLVNAPQATVQLRFLLDSKHIWSGTLETGGELAEDHNPSLDVVFMRLLARMRASEPGPTEGAANLILTVWGWSAPDGANDFDATLRSWDKAVTQASLDSVTIRSEGVAASWTVVCPHRETLEHLLPDYLSPRGLGYSLTAPGDVNPERPAEETLTP